MLEDANDATDSVVEVEAESAVEQLVECDKSSSSCVDQVCLESLNCVAFC